MSSERDSSRKLGGQMKWEQQENPQEDQRPEDGLESSSEPTLDRQSTSRWQTHAQSSPPPGAQPGAASDPPSLSAPRQLADAVMFGFSQRPDAWDVARDVTKNPLGQATTAAGRSPRTADAELARIAVAPRTDWESIERQARLYALRALGQEQSLCPPEYQALLDRTPIGKTPADLHPWKLDDDPLSGVALCSQAAGRYVIPFAEAVEHDLVACFAPERHQQPAVWLVNPWSAEKGNALRAICQDYGAWLQYAEKFAREVRRREAEMAARWSRTIGRP